MQEGGGGLGGDGGEGEGTAPDPTGAPTADTDALSLANTEEEEAKEEEEGVVGRRAQGEHLCMRANTAENDSFVAWCGITMTVNVKC